MNAKKSTDPHEPCPFLKSSSFEEPVNRQIKFFAMGASICIYAYLIFILGIIQSKAFLYAVNKCRAMRANCWLWDLDSQGPIDIINLIVVFELNTISCKSITSFRHYITTLWAMSKQKAR